MDFRLHHHAEIASTQDCLRDPRWHPGEVCLAERQTAGRGRQGRIWQSQAGASLTASALVTADADAARYLAQTAALALAAALDLEGIHAALKWPNDLRFQKKKLAGFLVEPAGHQRWILGMGVNLNQKNEDLALAGQPATSLWQIAGRTFAPTEVLQGFLKIWGPHLRLLNQGGWAPLAETYRRRLEDTSGLRQWRPSPEGPSEWVHVQSVAEDGRLAVRLADGETRWLASGDLMD